MKLQVWDTAGQEQFHSVASSYYRSAHGIMLLYDITSAESFMHVSKWVNNISSNAPTSVKQILIGNKCDMEENKRVIESSRGKMLAEELDMPFLETSAKTDTNVDAAFEAITELIMDGMAEREEGSGLRRETERKPSDVVELNASFKRKSKCCQSASV